MRLWLTAAVLQTLLLAAHCGHHRRIMATQATMPVSKGGWRPVLGSGGLLYGSFGTAPLHAPQYKIPVPVLDGYQSSARPLASRDAAKLTSIAQSYRPTTHRTVPSQAPIHQPISSYHNPFAAQNHGLLQNAGLNLQNGGINHQNGGFNFQNGLNYYKHIQNYPLDSVLIRNPHNPYAARPVFPQYPQNKFKQQQQQLQNNALQQLTSIQPLQFGQYQTSKPLDIFGKPVKSYARPTENKNQSGGTEIYKQEVYKLPDSDTASQSVSQQVKTAQQQSLGVHQNLGLQNQIYNPYGQYAFQDAALNPSILGSFGNFGLQPVKGGNQFQFPPTKSTFFPQHSTKQTIFNSFSYSPNYKTTPLIYSTTTPRLQTTPNQFQYSSTYTDFKITPVPNTKVSTPPKIDPNADAKDSFKPSPQDPFSKYHSNGFNKIIATTYNPLHTTANNVYEYSFQAQNTGQNQNYYDQKNINYNFDKKHTIHDSVPAGGNQQITKQYADPPSRPELDGTVRPTYEVTEATDSDVITYSSPAPWSLTSQPYDTKSEEAPQKQEYTDYGLQDPTPLPALPEEYAIVTEAEKVYDNSLNYDGQVESQSRRPLGDDFEPVGKQKLKDYYTYKVSTPSYDDIHVPRRTKKKQTTESSRLGTQETTTASTVASDEPVETLPTLPPYKHFKRPSTPEPSTFEKDRIRKRTKVRRRRPTLAQLNRNKELSTHAPLSIQPTDSTTEADEVHTIKPRVRPTTNGKLQSASTTISVSTDPTTSALPTVTATSPPIIRKKLAHRRLITTTPGERYETTTTPSFKIYEANKESQIMKIANRQQYKSTSAPYETPDYTHKQDEKDTPTSDVAVSLNDGLKTTSGTDFDLEFAFHKDVKPIEAKLEPVTNHYRETTTDSEASNEVTTFAPRPENASSIGRVPRPRLRNKYNRPKFSVKDYKSRLSSTTTTEKPVENTPKIRYPQRRIPYTESDSETTTERKKFTPKDLRPKQNSEASENEREREYYVRPNIRQRQTTSSEVESTTKVSARIRNGNRRTKPMDETTEPLPTTVHVKRPLRKKIKDSEIGESVQDISVTETTTYDPKDITSERTRSESAIMKIVDKKHHDHIEHLFEHSKRVSDLTLAASKDYNKPGMFKSVSSNSRRIPNYFTIATDDPILPIEAFFPQLNQKKET